jgi:hypothetical protein
VKHLSGRLLASPTNISLGWKGLPGTNTQVYYENPKITAVKSFIVQAPGENPIKLFTDEIYIFCNKLECLSLASLV